MLGEAKFAFLPFRRGSEDYLTFVFFFNRSVT